MPHEPYYSVTPRIFVDDPAAQVEFLHTVFGAGGDLEGERPTEVRIGDSIVMISSTEYRGHFPAFLYVYVDDTDATYRRAVDAGAETIEEPVDTPYGDRRATVQDPFGNIFQIAQRL